MGEIKIRSERGIKETEERKEGRREGEQVCSFEAFHHPPNSCSFPPPPVSERERAQQRRIERERERGGATEGE